MITETYLPLCWDPQITFFNVELKLNSVRPYCLLFSHNPLENEKRGKCNAMWP